MALVEPRPGTTMPIGRLLLVTGLCLLLAGSSFAQGASGALLDAYRQRSRQLLAVFQPALFSYPDVKTRGYDTIAYTALRGCGPPRMSDDMVDVLRPDLIAKSVDKAAYAFVLPPFTRYLLQYGQCLSPEQLQRARGLLSLPQQLFAHGTLNHAIMSASSYYLLAEHFPDQRWADPNGRPYTSSQVTERLKDLLLRRFRKYMADGFTEQLSPTYAVADLFPLLNLIDFAQDPDIRTAAEQAAIAQIALMRADSLDGALMPPVERENPPVQLTSNPPTNAADVLWLYYGGFPLSKARRDAPYAAMLAASRWRPPARLLALKSPSDLPYDIEVNTPSFGIWDAPTHPEFTGGAWIDREFAIGAGNEHMDPGGHNEHNVAFRILIRGLQPVGAIDCYQPYWLGDKGEDAWDLDRSSPFQYSWRSGSRGVLLYDIPATDPFPYPTSNSAFAERAKTAGGLHQLAECRLPKAADELKVTQSGVFARYGSVFVALHSVGGSPVEIDRSPSGPNLKGFMTMKVHAGRAAIYYSVVPALPGMSLATFSADDAATVMHYDPARSLFMIADAAGRRTEVGFKAPTSTTDIAAAASRAADDAAQPHRIVSSRILTIESGILHFGAADNHLVSVN